jgi:hypothetical protein
MQPSWCEPAALRLCLRVLRARQERQVFELNLVLSSERAAADQRVRRIGVGVAVLTMPQTQELQRELDGRAAKAGTLQEELASMRLQVACGGCVPELRG